MSMLNPHRWPAAVENAAFILSFGAFVVPLIVLIALRLSKRVVGTRVRWVIGTSMGALLLFLNPVFQLFTLSPIDHWLRSRWVEAAQRKPLIGNDAATVRGLFGEPCQIYPDHPHVCGAAGCQPVGNSYEVWDYVPVSFYWMGHAGHFKVFFNDGRVTSFKRGD